MRTTSATGLPPVRLLLGGAFVFVVVLTAGRVMTTTSRLESEVDVVAGQPGLPVIGQPAFPAGGGANKEPEPANPQVGSGSIDQPPQQPPEEPQQPPQQPQEEPPQQPQEEPPQQPQEEPPQQPPQQPLEEPPQQPPQQPQEEPPQQPPQQPEEQPPADEVAAVPDEQCPHNTLVTYGGQTICRPDVKCKLKLVTDLPEIVGASEFPDVPEDYCLPFSPKTKICQEKFVKGIRSDCFLSSGRVQCLPRVFMPGMAKSGTTAVYRYLTQHPFHVPSQKEPRYYTNKRGSMSKYLKNFNDLGNCISTDEGNSYANYFGADLTPDYLARFVDIPKAIGEANPNAKYIMMFRDPVTRTYSDYKWINNRPNGEQKAKIPYPMVPDAYDSAFDAASKKLQACLDYNGTGPNPHISTKFNDALAKVLPKINDPRYKNMGCAFDRGLDYKENVNGKGTVLRVTMSLYAYLLRLWLEYVPSDQIIIVTKSALQYDKVNTMNTLCDFIEIPRYDFEDEVRNLDIEKMPPSYKETDAKVSRFYDPHNQLLRELVKEFNIKVAGDLTWPVRVVDEADER